MAYISWKGNKKLVNTAKVQFAIFNLPALITCPFATKNCAYNCYARSAEIMYKSVLPCRMRNLYSTFDDNFVQEIISQIEKHLKNQRKKRLIVFRIHESGDFYSQEYTEKWVRIAKHFENNSSIIFTAYTKSLIFFVKSGYGTDNFPKNFIVRSSLWSDTAAENVRYTLDYSFPVYTAYTKTELEKAVDCGAFECKCENCGECLECYKNDKKLIAVKIH